MRFILMAIFAVLSSCSNSGTSEQHLDSGAQPAPDGKSESTTDSTGVAGQLSNDVPISEASDKSPEPNQCEAVGAYPPDPVISEPNVLPNLESDQTFRSLFEQIKQSNEVTYALTEAINKTIRAVYHYFMISPSYDYRNIVFDGQGQKKWIQTLGSGESLNDAYSPKNWGKKLDDGGFHTLATANQKVYVTPGDFLKPEESFSNCIIIAGGGIDVREAKFCTLISGGHIQAKNLVSSIGAARA